MKIVVVAPSGGDIAGGVADLSSAGRVIVLSREAESPEPDACVVGVPPSKLSRTISGLLHRTLLGRVLRRLSPWDPGAVFARDVRRSAEARSVLADASLLVATERDALYCVWRQARRASGRVIAVHGFAAARAAIQKASRR